MLRSMFAAVSGLRAHQTMMDVVGNNISNVNTAGFKGARTTFQDAMNQVLRGSSQSSSERAGNNPMQIGLGAQVGGVDTVFNQGSIQLTGRSLDVAVQGEGFFLAQVGQQTYYTRAGAFNIDSTGSLVGPNGSRIMGWMADDAGVINEQSALQAITLPTGQIISPSATENITAGGNLPADAAVGATVNTSIAAYDTQGTLSNVNLVFEKTAANVWEVGDGTNTFGTVTFDAEGLIDTGATTLPITIPAAQSPTGLAIDLLLNEQGQELKQFAGSTTAEARHQDGSEMGFLRGFEFGADGSITGRFSNGQTKALGAIALATFNNAGGLQKEGQNLFVGTLNSGQPQVARPGAGDAGTLSPGSLEMSNVDLSQEFTNLIIAQRGFQANARSITASDEMLSDIVNLKR